MTASLIVILPIWFNINCPCNCCFNPISTTFGTGWFHSPVVISRGTCFHQQQVRCFHIFLKIFHLTTRYPDHIIHVFIRPCWSHYAIPQCPGFKAGFVTVGPGPWIYQAGVSSSVANQSTVVWTDKEGTDHSWHCRASNCQ